MAENEAKKEALKNDLTRLSRKDLWKLYIYSQGFVSGFNYEKQEAPGFTFSMIPVIEKVYKNEEDKKDAYRMLRTGKEVISDVMGRCSFKDCTFPLFMR